MVVPFWGTRAELADVRARSRGSHLAHVERFPLTDVANAYKKLRAGEIQGRAVIVPAATC